MFLSHVSVTGFCHRFLSQVSVTGFCHRFLSQVSVTGFCQRFLSLVTILSRGHDRLNQHLVFDHKKFNVLIFQALATIFLNPVLGFNYFLLWGE